MERNKKKILNKLIVSQRIFLSKESHELTIMNFLNLLRNLFLNLFLKYLNLFLKIQSAIKNSKSNNRK